jgi:TRAP-type C4-dicarboxylate transport system permease small subunit
MVIGSLLLVLMVLLAVANVVMRLLHIPFPGAYELIGFGGAAMIALALGRTQETRSHVAVDILTRRLSPRINRWIDRFKYLVKFSFALVLARQLWIWASVVKVSGETSETLKFDYSFFIQVVAFGFLVLALTVAMDFAGTWRSPAEETP